MQEFGIIYDRYLAEHINRSFENKRLVLNSVDVIQGINQSRDEIFSNRYKIPDGYRYENLYNMLYEEDSEEQKEYLDREEFNELNRMGLSNIFYPKKTDKRAAEKDALPLPEFSDKAPTLYTHGFIVNKNGKNLELAYEFLNGLLNEELQMAVYNSTNGRYYPVNEELEDDIENLEASQEISQQAKELKKIALKQVKSSECKPKEAQNHKQSNFYFALKKDLSRFILADTAYTEEQLKQELQKLEDKYNIWLNE